MNLPGFVPWLILIIGLILTLVSWHTTRQDELDQAEIRFNAEIVEHVSAIQNRMQDYEQMLRAGVAFINSSNYVDRGEWKTFERSLRVQDQFPGTLGFAYSIFVPHKEVKAHEARMREEGFSDYHIHPLDPKLPPTAIIYLEPLNSRNIAAIGYNMYKEPNRLAAMKRAVETGDAALAGRVILVQENKGPVQAGTLMYLPVYRKGASLETTKDRWEAIVGVVYAPLRMGDLMGGILGERGDFINLHIFDEESHAEGNLMYNSDEIFASQQGAEFQKTEVVEIAGRKWTLDFASTADFNATIDTSKPWLIAIGGTIVSFLLFGFVHGLARSHGQAIKLAKEMTVEIRKLSVAVEQSPSVVIITNTSGNIIYVNPRFTDVTGYDEEEVLGNDPKILKSGHTKTEEYDVLWQTIRAGNIWRGEMYNRKKNGDFYWASVAIAPIRDEGDEITGFVSLQEDITVRKEAEVAMLEAKEAAENANRSKSEFLANMSHEIRTPMNAIIGMSQLVLETVLDAYQKKHLTTVSNSARGLLRLLNEILDFSKIESGKMEILPEAFNLVDILKSALDSFSVSVQKKGLDLHLEVSDELSECFNGDSARLTQVIQNLVGNAIKFTKEGEVVVSARGTEQGVCFSISDTGIGIPPDRQVAIFESFTQADGGTSREHGGTGLGITISKRIVELMGGKIWMESEVGKGSIFSFDVLLDEVDCVADKALRNIVVLKPLHILLAEDQGTNSELATIRLEERGHEVTLAQNGELAVQAWNEAQESKPFDLVLMDLQMPVMNGFEATQAIREQEGDVHTQIIALTANSMEGDDQKCYEAGMDGYVSKPIDFDKLWAEIARLMPDAVLERIEVEAEESDATENPFGNLEGISVDVGVKRWGGSVKIYRKALLGFVQDHSESVQEIRTALANGEVMEAKSLTHALKGVAGNLAINQVNKSATLLDTALRENQLEEAETLLIQLEEMLVVAIASIRTLKNPVEADVPEKEVDVAVVAPLLQELAGFIREEDVDGAEQSLDHLEAMLPQVTKIRSLVENYDFEEALLALTTIAESIGIEIK